MVRVVSCAASPKAKLPIVVMLLGIERVVSCVAWLKA